VHNPMARGGDSEDVSRWSTRLSKNESRKERVST